MQPHKKYLVLQNYEPGHWSIFAEADSWSETTAAREEAHSFGYEVLIVQNIPTTVVPKPDPDYIINQPLIPMHVEHLRPSAPNWVRLPSGKFINLSNVYCVTEPDDFSVDLWTAGDEDPYRLMYEDAKFITEYLETHTGVKL